MVTVFRFFGSLIGQCDDTKAVEFLPIRDQFFSLNIILKYACFRNSAMGAQVCGRCNFGDQAIRDIDASFKQIVILGAGNDTRFHRLPNLPVDLYEVDVPTTQESKRSLLKNPNGNVKFVSANFETESWMEKLVQAGFDKSKKTLILWEGVTYYLTKEAIKDTLQSISQCAKGSKLVLDYGHVRNSGNIALRFVLFWFNLIGETWRTNFTDKELLDLLKEYKLKPISSPIFGIEAVRGIKTGNVVKLPLELKLIAASLS
ncbi:S-adenosyl-L-methionine-dependent methyltransferase [Globomyces pollinis-pini]|nr:S-adenosyl-L-methionine-dependent methyltransferase [Globomyces pollinis-pini]